MSRPGGGLGIEADGVVGSIPLRNGGTLQIVPKVGQAPFLKMLFRSLGTTNQLQRDYDEFVQYGLDDSSGLGWMAARQLLDGVESILSRGMESERFRISRESMIARGRMNPARTALGLARRSRQPIVSDVSERSFDTPEHRVIERALVLSLPFLEEEDRQRLLEVHSKWTRRTGASALRSTDPPLVQERIVSRGYGGSRSYYRSVMVLGRVTRVEGEAEQLDALRAFVEHMYPGRWEAPRLRHSVRGGPLTAYLRTNRPYVRSENPGPCALIGTRCWYTPLPPEPDRRDLERRQRRSA